MARNASRIRLGYYPLPAAEGTRLRRLLDFAPGASAVDGSGLILACNERYTQAPQNIQCAMSALWRNMAQEPCRTLFVTR
jgi:hypothetical protein